MKEKERSYTATLSQYSLLSSTLLILNHVEKGSHVVKKYNGCECTWNLTCISEGTGETVEDAVRSLCHELKNNASEHTSRVKEIFAINAEGKIDEDRGCFSIAKRWKIFLARLKGKPVTVEEETKRQLKDAIKYHAKPFPDSTDDTLTFYRKKETTNE